jgi:hypothetical protein
VNSTTFRGLYLGPINPPHICFLEEDFIPGLVLGTDKPATHMLSGGGVLLGRISEASVFE